ncbi:MAG: hypothetical protein KatS3mg024_1779 [Armatimonadota bacterium]|nr:MAG: hypothetical protein KatS3mg024_1779 [Armatimonadota bacterium]
MEPDITAGEIRRLKALRRIVAEAREAQRA